MSFRFILLLTHTPGLPAVMYWLMHLIFIFIVYYPFWLLSCQPTAIYHVHQLCFLPKWSARTVVACQNQ